MIIVNNQGSGAEAYAPLEHAAWNGFTPTDLVFPSFLFAVGNAMAFTMPKFQSMDQSVSYNEDFEENLHDIFDRLSVVLVPVCKTKRIESVGDETC